MTRAIPHLAMACSLAFAGLLHGQSLPSPVRSALQQSLSEMHAQTVQDITLNGTVEYIAGSTDENGSYTFRATASGNSRTDLDFPSGTRSETRQAGNGAPVGTWTAGDGVLHPIMQHNLMSGYWWSSPALIVSDLLTDSSMVVAFDGIDGSLAHFSAYQQLTGASTGTNATLQHLTSFDLWLDSTSLLPAKLSFCMHPDSNAGVDIPVQIQFSNYQMLDGILVPTHVQRFIDNTLVVDAQIQSVSINMGLTASAFSLQ